MLTLLLTHSIRFLSLIPFSIGLLKTVSNCHSGTRTLGHTPLFYQQQSLWKNLPVVTYLQSIVLAVLPSCMFYCLGCFAFLHVFNTFKVKYLNIKACSQMIVNNMLLYWLCITAVQRGIVRRGVLKG